MQWLYINIISNIITYIKYWWSIVNTIYSNVCMLFIMKWCQIILTTQEIYDSSIMDNAVTLKCFQFALLPIFTSAIVSLKQVATPEKHCSGIKRQSQLGLKYKNSYPLVISNVVCLRMACFNWNSIRMS